MVGVSKINFTRGDLSNVAQRMYNTAKKIKAKLLIISFESDWVFPSWHSKFIQKNAMKVGISSSYVELEGSYGHDSFLFASDEYCNIIENFLNFNNG